MSLLCFQVQKLGVHTHRGLHLKHVKQYIDLQYHTYTFVAMPSVLTLLVTAEADVLFKTKHRGIFHAKLHMKLIILAEALSATFMLAPQTD